MTQGRLDGTKNVKEMQEHTLSRTKGGYHLMDHTPRRGSGRMDFEELYPLFIAKYTIAKSYCVRPVIRNG